MLNTRWQHWVVLKVNQFDEKNKFLYRTVSTFEDCNILMWKDGHFQWITRMLLYVQY